MRCPMMLHRLLQSCKSGFLGLCRVRAGFRSRLGLSLKKKIRARFGPEFILTLCHICAVISLSFHKCACAQSAKTTGKEQSTTYKRITSKDDFKSFNKFNSPA